MESAKSANALLCGSVMMVKCFFSVLDARLLQRVGRRQNLHQGFGGAARFGDGDEVRLLQIEALQRLGPAEGIGIVVKFHPGLGRFCAARSAPARPDWNRRYPAPRPWRSLSAPPPAWSPPANHRCVMGYPAARASCPCAAGPQPVQRGRRRRQRLRCSAPGTARRRPTSARSREMFNGDLAMRA